MAKCCNSVYPWIVVVLAVLWIVGSVFPTFGRQTTWVPWLPLIVLVTAVSWATCNCKK